MARGCRARSRARCASWARPWWPGTFDPDGLDHLDDDEAQARLVELRGIGPWSAQMFLLHELRRPDVFPAGDVGLRTALGRLEGLATPPTQPETVALALRWTPYRSYAAAHLWRPLGE